MGMAALVLSGASVAHASTVLGEPTFIGEAVTDVSATTSQWTSGLGEAFGPTVTSAQQVNIPGTGTVQVTLHQAFSVDGTVDVMSADNPVGPWAASASSSSQFLGYAVSDVQASGQTLMNAGMSLVAQSSDGSFAFYRGAEGATIELVNQSLVPAPGANPAQPGISLGQPEHFDFYLCDVDDVQAKLTTALGVVFAGPVPVPVFPMTFPDGSTLLLNAKLSASQGLQGVPIYLEGVTPHPFPFTCGSDNSTLRPDYTVPLGSMPQVDAQMKAAGYTVAAETTTVGQTIEAFYVGTNNLTVELDIVP